MFFGIMAIIASFFINWYLLLWSLKGWGIINLPPWLNDFIFMLDTEDGESIVFLTDYEYMLDLAKMLVMKELGVNQFKPNDELFLFFF